LVDAIKEENASVKLIAPQVGGIKGSNGKLIAAHEKFGGGPSFPYDTVALPPQKTERFSSRLIQRYATSLRMRSLIVNSLATANLQRNFWKKPIHIRLIVRNLLLLMNPVCRKLSLQSVVACVAGRIEFFCSAGTCFANVLFARIIPLHSAYRFNVNKLNFRIFLHFVR